MPTVRFGKNGELWDWSFINSASWTAVISRSSYEWVFDMNGVEIKLVGDFGKTPPRAGTEIYAMEAYDPSTGLGYSISGLDLVTFADIKLYQSHYSLMSLYDYDDRLVVHGSRKADGIFGGLNNDQLKGLGGNDNIGGDAGDDKIWGGDGSDTIAGGYGRNILTGGRGNDFFYFEVIDGTAKRHNVITDFSRTHDVIDLHDIYGGNGSLKWIGKNEFSDTKSDELRFDLTYDSNHHKITMIEGSRGDPGVADLFIELTGHINLSKVDFIL